MASVDRTRGRPRKRYSPLLGPPKIPVVDMFLSVVGWTSAPPEIRQGMLRHSEAEEIFGGPITCVYVQLERAEDAIAAGAPSQWRGPWRCLAIAPQGTPMHSEAIAASSEDRRRAHN